MEKENENEFLDLCPKCGKKGITVEINPNTGQILVLCSNEVCHLVQSKTWL